MTVVRKTFSHILLFVISPISLFHVGPSDFSLINPARDAGEKQNLVSLLKL